jgi:DNA adenine methylase
MIPPEDAPPSDLKAPFPYFGGKSRVGDLVWDRLGNVNNYMEPFFGSGAVLLKRPSPPQTETVNDIDCYLANFWRAIAGDPEGVAQWADWPVNEADLHARHWWLVQQQEFRERMKREPHFFDIKIAGWWVWGISQWIGSGWCSHPEWTGRAGRNGQGIHRKKPHLSSSSMGIFSKRASDTHLPGLNDNASDVHAGRTSPLMQYFEMLGARLRRVRVCCGDWTRVLGPAVTISNAMTGIFLDPPYNLRIVTSESNTDPIYNDHDNNLSAAVRQWAIENGDNPLLRIALCGYEEEHVGHMPATWDCVWWKANGGYGNISTNQNRFKERIWFSPHCLRPQENLFQDPSFAENPLIFA